MRNFVLGTILLLITIPAHAQDIGGRAGIGVGGFELQEVSRGAYGLYGGPSLDFGRFRVRGEGYFMLAEKPGAEVARELGLCEDGSCQELFVWGSGAAVYDVYESDDTRVYLGAGADLGHLTGPYATAGAIFSGRWGLGVQAGPEQLFLSAFIWR